MFCLRNSDGDMPMCLRKTRLNWEKLLNPQGAETSVMGMLVLIKADGQWYAVYHARDYGDTNNAFHARNTRICKLHVADGVITAERYPDHI